MRFIILKRQSLLHPPRRSGYRQKRKISEHPKFGEGWLAGPWDCDICAEKYTLSFSFMYQHANSSMHVPFLDKEYQYKNSKYREHQPESITNWLPAVIFDALLVIGDQQVQEAGKCLMINDTL